MHGQQNIKIHRYKFKRYAFVLWVLPSTVSYRRPLLQSVKSNTEHASDVAEQHWQFGRVNSATSATGLQIGCLGWLSFGSRRCCHSVQAVAKFRSVTLPVAVVARRRELLISDIARQVNKLKNCYIRLVIYLNCTMMHGLTNLKFDI